LTDRVAPRKERFTAGVEPVMLYEPSLPIQEWRTPATRLGSDSSTFVQTEIDCKLQASPTAPNVRRRRKPSTFS
jgi:hypothetical protein